MSLKTTKVLVIGLDCMDPGLVFRRWRRNLPILDQIIESSLHGRLRSTDPPITVPAWTSMFTGRDPGELGIYGFRNRQNYGYDALTFANTHNVRYPRLWDILSDHTLPSFIIGVPQTYPPSPLNGIMVSDFLTPSLDKDFTYPAEFKAELNRVTPDYMLDVQDFRGDSKDEVLNQIYRMTAERLILTKYCIREKDWRLGITVEIGLDRLHHAFWGYMDKASRYYEPGHRYELVIQEYYEYIDRKLAELLDLIDDDTYLLIVSDHGAQNMAGGFCINEWLLREGYLSVKAYPEVPGALEPENIDLDQTKAWGEGGYYARCMLNVAGREPAGILAPEAADQELNELKRRLAYVESDGRILNNAVFEPQDLYQKVEGIPPDLLVYIDRLRYRSIGGIGYNKVLIEENDTGADHANHNFYGLFILHGPGIGGKNLNEISIYDVMPTLLDMFGLPALNGIRGKSLV